jgi:glycosyltransferase involved in cell wall biosynthesis
VKNIAPLVSIVVIAYNEEKHISAAIESALNQTYENIEVIVVNDGSTDNTLAMASQYEPRIKLITQKNSGGCSSPRNTGLKLASGRYVAFLDADDILVPERIQIQVDLFSEYKSICMVIGNYKNFRGTEQYNDHFSTCPELLLKLQNSGRGCILFDKGEAATLLISENFSSAISPLYLRNILLELGGFDEKLLACEDFHLNYRIAQRYEVMVDNRIVFHRRLHSSNMSSNQLKMLRFYCLSRLGLANQETDLHRKSLLRKRVTAYLKSYVREIIRTKSALQVKYAALIFFKNFISCFYRT